jgi:cytochrome c biogenesis protein CcdA
MSFSLYLIGTVVLVCGIGYICHLAHVPHHWIAAIVIVLLGAGIMGAVSSTRRRDPN